MAEVLAKISGPPHPWQIQADPNGQLTISLAAPITVHYSTGSADTLAAYTPAAECPLDPQYVWCPYVIPGDGTLHAVKESAIPTLSGDWTILGHVYQHEVVPHQPAAATTGGGGGGATVKAYSMVAHTTIANGGFLFVPFEHTDWDQGAPAPQHDDVTNPEQLLCQVAGVYHSTAWLNIRVVPTALGGSIGSGPILARLLHYDALDNEEIVAADVRFLIDNPGTSFPLALNPTGLCTMEVGDVLKLGLRNLSGVTITMTGTSASDYADGDHSRTPSLGWHAV